MKRFSYTDIMGHITAHLLVINQLQDKVTSVEKKIFYEGAKTALIHLSQSLLDRKEVD